MGSQSQQTIDTRQKGKRRRGGREESSWGEAQTDNIVVLRLPGGQTRQENKEKWNEMQNKGNVNIYRAATGKKQEETENVCSRRNSEERQRPGRGGREEEQQVPQEEDWLREGRLTTK